MSQRVPAALKLPLARKLVAMASAPNARWRFSGHAARRDWRPPGAGKYLLELGACSLRPHRLVCPAPPRPR